MTSRNPSVPIVMSVKDSHFYDIKKLSGFPKAVKDSLEYLHYRTFIHYRVKMQHDITSHLVRLLYITIKNLINPDLVLNPINSLGSLNWYLKYRNTPKLNRAIPLSKGIDNVLILHQAGGGLKSLNAIKLFTITTELRTQIIQKLNEIPPNYFAVHIPHTDYETDYRTFLDKIKNELRGQKVLVCSDNFEVRKFALGVLAETCEPFEINDKIDSHRIDLKMQHREMEPLHYQWHLPLETRRVNNIRMFTELVALARAKQIYFSEVVRLKTGYIGYSGFSLLADSLRRNPAELDEWLG